MFIKLNICSNCFRGFVESTALRRLIRGKAFDKIGHIDALLEHFH